MATASDIPGVTLLVQQANKTTMDEIESIANNNTHSDVQGIIEKVKTLSGFQYSDAISIYRHVFGDVSILTDDMSQMSLHDVFDRQLKKLKYFVTFVQAANIVLQGDENSTQSKIGDCVAICIDDIQRMPPGSSAKFNAIAQYVSKNTMGSKKLRTQRGEMEGYVRKLHRLTVLESQSDKLVKSSTIQKRFWIVFTIIVIILCLYAVFAESYFAAIAAVVLITAIILISIIVRFANIKMGNWNMSFDTRDDIVTRNVQHMFI